MNASFSSSMMNTPATALPRLGFIGAGWIGRMRMQSLYDARLATFCAVHDVSPDAINAVTRICGDLHTPAELDDILAAELDGLVIATPSALHAEQAVAALGGGKAVFCQKPLARTEAETRRVIDAARAANKLLAVDFSYRHLAGMNALRQLIASGELGEIFATDLVFHNAYGPDKNWFYDVNLSGGGCLIDLGIHLVDLALWLLGDGEVQRLSSTLFHQGQRLQPPLQQVEDYATADFLLDDAHVRLCCSWNLHAGRDAVISAAFHGTQGGVMLHNVNGSFYDFEIHRFNGTARQQLAGYPDDWGGRAILDWAQRLQQGEGYDPQVESVIKVAQIIDRIYQR